MLTLEYEQRQASVDHRWLHRPIMICCCQFLLTIKRLLVAGALHWPSRSHTPGAIPVVAPRLRSRWQHLFSRDHFPSKSSHLQYVNGFMCSDGSVLTGATPIFRSGQLFQSNLTFLAAMN